MTDRNLLPEIILDVRKALGAEAYLAALSLVLTIPDICGKAEYGDKMCPKKRYITWYNEWIGQYEKPPEDDETAYLSGEVVYQLRCSLFHQGTPNIEKEKIKEESCKIDYFQIVIEPKNSEDIYIDGSAAYLDNRDKSKIICYDVNLRRLCNCIIGAAEAYARKNKDKFSFFQYSIKEYGFGEIWE